MRITKRGAGFAGVGAIASAGLGFGFNWLLARGLGTAGTGLVLSAATWFTVLLAVLKLGTDTALVRAGAHAASGSTPVAAGSALRWCLAGVAPVAVVASGLIWVFAPAAARVLADDAGADSVGVVRVCALALAPAIIGFVVLAALRGIGHIGPLVAVDQLGKPGLRAAGALGLVLTGSASAFAFAAAWSLPAIVGLVVALAVLYRYRSALMQRRPLSRETRRTEFRAIWAFALPRAASQVVDIVSASAGVLVLAVMSTASETGQFATALRVALAGYVAYHALRLIIAPSLAHAFSLSDVGRAQRIYSSATTLMIAISWPLYFFLVGGAGAVMSWFGAGFVPAAATLRVLAVAALVVTLLGNLQAVILMSGKSTPALVAVSLGLAANLAITVGLATTMGSMGAAIGWAGSVVIEALVLARMVTRLGLRPLDTDVRRIAVSSAIALGVGAAALVAVPNFAIAVTVFAIVASGWAWWSRKLVLSAWHALTE